MTGYRIQCCYIVGVVFLFEVFMHELRIKITAQRVVSEKLKQAFDQFPKTIPKKSVISMSN